MKIDDIHLKTAHLNDLKTFYTDTFDCSITNLSANEFTVHIGATDVTFSETTDGTDPSYHFAINVPQNQFADAVTWLSDRVELLADADTGDHEHFFEDWNAHAVYGLDPANNLLELIARHDLTNDSDRPFGSENFHRISEIGLSVPNVRRAVEALRNNVGVTLRKNHTAPITDDTSFAAVGDDHGLFIVIEEGRGWFPVRTSRNQAAAAYPVIIGTSETTKEYAFPNLPYQIIPS
jgi:catechol-2,3-dioxygenase